MYVCKTANAVEQFLFEILDTNIHPFLKHQRDIILCSYMYNIPDLRMTVAVQIFKAITAVMILFE